MVHAMSTLLHALLRPQAPFQTGLGGSQCVPGLEGMCGAPAGQDKWSAAYSVRTVLVSIQSLLGDPNNDSPLNTYAAKVCAFTLCPSPWCNFVVDPCPCSFASSTGVMVPVAAPPSTAASMCCMRPWQKYPRGPMIYGANVGTWVSCSSGATRRSTGRCCAKSMMSCKSSSCTTVQDATSAP